MLATILLAAVIDVAAADGAFAELEAICRADGGRMWGRSLCGPVVFADPTTRQAVARKDGRTFTATLPQSIGIANTAVEWNGDEWTMLVWPLPSDALARRAMLAHESFHRVQDELGFRSTGPGNHHLDTVDGRALLRLEWRALVRALSGDGEALADALAFRARRHALFPKAAEEERQLEMHEGLANHTGYALAVPDLARRAAVLAKLVRSDEQQPSFVRSFAYTSGPLWGALLDRVSPRWERSLNADDDLARRVARAYGVRASTDLDAAASRYRAAEVITAEARRDNERQARLRRLRARLIEGPLLILPLGMMQMTMDPNGLVPLDDRGTVYRTITLRDAWGSIEARDALLTSDFQRLIVPAPPNADARAGDGWTLTLNEGWRIAPGGRAGDFVVTK